MNRKVLLDVKSVLSSVEGFNGVSDLHLEEERIDEHPFSFDAGVVSYIDEGIFDVSSFSKKFNSVYFLDGIQRTVLLGEVDLSPIFLHFSAAAIMHRQDRKVIPFVEPVVQSCLITSNKFKFESEIPVEVITPKNNNCFYKHSSRLRKQLERDLLKKGIKIVGRDEILINDGPLHYSEELSKSGNIIGVIKRHSASYLPDRRVLYDLKAGERTGAFVLERGPDSKSSFPVVSFYLRLFPKKDPYYGIVRVEVPQRMIHSKEDIDAFAGFVFSERFPFDFKTHQSDKKLYPVNLCEKYLSSKLPSLDLVKAFLADVLQ